MPQPRAEIHHRRRALQSIRPCEPATQSSSPSRRQSNHGGSGVSSDKDPSHLPPSTKSKTNINAIQPLNVSAYSVAYDDANCLRHQPESRDCQRPTMPEATEDLCPSSNNWTRQKCGRGGDRAAFARVLENAPTKGGVKCNACHHHQRNNQF